MSPIALQRVAEGCGGGLRVVDSRHRDPTNRRQGKRPAFGAAYVVGKIEEFTDTRDTHCWRFLQIVQTFQRFARRRLKLSRVAAP